VYEYHLFLSYQRTSPTVPAWIRTHFYPRLRESLDDNVDYDVKIFFDEDVAGGSLWPEEMRMALQHSRILLPVCSPKYFMNEWCVAEWHSMAKREELLGHGSLIYPVIFSDSQNFPDWAKERRMRSFKDWNLPYPQFQASADYLVFHQEVGRITDELVSLIAQAPEWQPGWPIEMPHPSMLGPSRLPRF
jgi:hypothetical protein